MVRKPNGNIINRAIQCLYPLELRQESKEDVIVKEKPDDDGSDSENLDLPPATTEGGVPPIPLDEEFEPVATGSGGERVGYLFTPTTTRSGLISKAERLPSLHGSHGMNCTNGLNQITIS